MDNELAVRIQGLGKRYRIGVQSPAPGTLGGKIKHTLSSPLQWLASEIRAPTDAEILWALKDITFDVKVGEVVGVIGRNGAGKSTLLKILSRITEPSDGFAEIKGRIGALLEVGTGMHPELTGRENVYQNGCILGMRKWEIDKNFDEIVAFSGIEKFIDTPVKRYSSGQRVRLGFAIAAHLEPEILIVDEVLAVGDLEFQKKCLGKMKNVASHGRTVIFVSHNMPSVRSLCSRAICLEHGSISASGNVDDVIKQYTNYNATSEQNGNEIKGDKGRGEECRLFFNDAQRKQNLLCGEQITISAEFISPEALDHIGAGLVIRDSEGTAVTGMSSVFQGISTSSRKNKRWALKADLRKLPLIADNFSIDVIVYSKEQEVARFTNAVLIELETADVFGRGKPLPAGCQHFGPFYWDPEWNVKAIN